MNFSGVQQLFLLGAIAIAVGVFTYSKRVMMTVGNSLMTLSPVGALVVVIANSLVLFIFSSAELSNFVASLGLPPIPLIPVSSSQAVVGAVIGIGLLQGIKGMRQIKWGVLAGIASGWVTTPIIAAVIGFTLLFVVQNVFSQQVYQEVYYQLSPPVLQRLADKGIPTNNLQVQTEPIAKAVQFRKGLRQQVRLNQEQETLAIASAQLYPMQIDSDKVASLRKKDFSQEQYQAIANLEGQSFNYKWQLAQALAKQSDDWKQRKDSQDNKKYNKKLQAQIDAVKRVFHIQGKVNSNENEDRN